MGQKNETNIKYSGPVGWLLGDSPRSTTPAVETTDEQTTPTTHHTHSRRKKVAADVMWKKTYYKLVWLCFKFVSCETISNTSLMHSFIESSRQRRRRLCSFVDILLVVEIVVVVRPRLATVVLLLGPMSHLPLPLLLLPLHAYAPRPVMRRRRRYRPYDNHLLLEQHASRCRCNYYY